MRTQRFYNIIAAGISLISRLISAFRARVGSDAGTFEAEQCLRNSIPMNLYDKASLIITPNAYKAGKIYALKPTSGSGDLTFSRASARTRRNSSGVIESLANNVPALHYPAGGGCPAWLFELQRTNQIRNSEANGAVAGTPGSLPTNWNTLGVTALSRQVVGTGVENGLTYLDVRFFGVASVISQPITAESFFLATTSAGQSWSFGCNVKFVEAPQPPLSARIGIDWRNGSTAFLEQPITITSELNRFTLSGVAPSGVTTSMGYLNFIMNNGSTYDFTVRIAGNMYEQGAFPTSYTPTSSSIATRLNDIASLVRNVTTEATIYADTYLQAGSLSDGNVYSIFDLRVTGTQRVSLYRFNNQIHADIVNSTIQFSGSIYNIPTLVQGQRYRIAVRLTATQMVVFINGAIVYTSATLSMPNLSSGNTIYHGNLAGSGSVWGGLLGPLYIADSALTNEECISLTTS